MFSSFMSIRWAPLLLALLCAACSPSLNWRETRFADTSLVALLPCDPDHAQRRVPLGGVPTDLVMAGCEAADATFAVMLADTSATQANALLAGWRAATMANIHAKDVKTQPFHPRGALVLPDSVRISAEGQGPTGRPVVAEAVWVARIGADGKGAQLVHAVMYSERPMPDAAEIFFGGLRL